MSLLCGSGTRRAGAVTAVTGGRADYAWTRRLDSGSTPAGSRPSTTPAAGVEPQHRSLRADVRSPSNRMTDVHRRWPPVADLTHRIAHRVERGTGPNGARSTSRTRTPSRPVRTAASPPGQANNQRLPPTRPAMAACPADVKLPRHAVPWLRFRWHYLLLHPWSRGTSARWP